MLWCEGWDGIGCFRLQVLVMNEWGNSWCHHALPWIGFNDQIQSAYTFSCLSSQSSHKFIPMFIKLERNHPMHIILYTYIIMSYECHITTKSNTHQHKTHQQTTYNNIETMITTSPSSRHKDASIKWNTHSKPQHPPRASQESPSAAPTHPAS